MIQDFDKEEFMQQPALVCSQQPEVLPLRVADDGNVMHRPPEQTILLHIGDEEYDVKELLWRLLEAERKITALERRPDPSAFVTNDRLSQLEAKLYALENEFRRLRSAILDIGNNL